ncbi:MAG: suppressor of fused domain protein [Eubacteriaceae bacterium]|nr:suppressor of fused domain protein [Eubacteriaceae bacterium]
MTADEYKKIMAFKKGWSPGIDAIDDCMKSIYGNQIPQRFDTNPDFRVASGGTEYLDGFSVYRSPHGYLHLVSFGMSELYANEMAFGMSCSKWGYEMTIKIPYCEPDDFMWAFDLLAKLAKYTFESNHDLRPHQHTIDTNKPLKPGSGSKLTGLMVVSDTELNNVNTIHGQLGFIQIVGITKEEVSRLVFSPGIEASKHFVEIMKKDNPYLVTYLDRKLSYAWN